MEKEAGFLKRAYQGYRKVLLKRHAVWLMLSIILAFAFIFSSSPVLAYNWDFSTPSDYTYNATEIIVASGYAQLNGSAILPYSWWHLNENTGTAIADSSVNSYNGTALNKSVWIAGKLNSAMQFNGINQSINFGQIANFERTQKFSIEFWVKTSSTTASQIIGRRLQSGNSNGWSVQITTDGTLAMGLSNNAGTGNAVSVRSTHTINNNIWRHVIITYAGTSLASGIKIYIDGVKETNDVRTDGLTASILSTANCSIASRNLADSFFDGSVDEVVLYISTELTQEQVDYRYNNGTGIETLPNFLFGYYTIQTINNFTFGSKLWNFTEIATKTGSDIRYIVSDDGINWKFWNSSVWSISNGSWGQSSPASSINSNMQTLGSSGNFSFKAVLHSNDGTYTPYLDNIEVVECSEDWIENDTNCGTNLNASCSGYDSKTKIYYDKNSCGSTNNLPADNGTCASCNYCSPSWFCGSLALCSNFWQLCNYIHEENATNYGTCCAVTHLDSDCNFTGDLGQYKQTCGDMVTTLTTNADYPYVDCNTTATFGLVLTINNTRQDFEHLFMEFPTIPYTFNWTWSNATQSYSINLLFITEGDYPYVVWSDYPYGVMQNITGTLKVRCPCYITVNGYTLFPTNATEPYKNTHAYIGMELTSQKKTGMTGSRNPYDTQLEDFLTPLTFSHYPYKMFHAPYVNGQAVVKLWEKNETYAIRLFDGDVTFQQGVYSTVNATRLYKTNIFLGTQKFTCGTGGDEQFNYFFTQKELQPFTWLFNWIFLILIIAVIVIAGFLLFMIPPFAMPFGIGGVVLLCILRIVLWVAIG